MSNVSLAPKAPEFKIKIPAKAAEALQDWLEQARHVRDTALRGTADLRALEKKRTQIENKIATLEARADEDDAASALPGLQIQLDAINRKIEGKLDGDYQNTCYYLLSELRPILSKAMTPSIEAEVERMATPLFPYFHHRESALYVVGQSDWLKTIRGYFLSEYKTQPFDHAIHVVEAALRCELPYPYQVNPQS